MRSYLKFRHLPRYGELARLLVAHRGAFGDERADAGEDAAQLVRTLEEMGPTYVKLGQLLSSRVDLLPPAYTDALGHLQDHAEPIAPAEVRRVIEEELGSGLSRAFASFDDEPLGSASLAQVHRAVTTGGLSVAVKVQRPGIRGRILDDMDVISELAAAFDEHIGAANRAGLSGMAEQFRHALLAELDYAQEASNLRMLSGFLQPYDRLFAPEPIEELSTSRVLTMTLVEGRSVATVVPVEAQALDGGALANQLFKAYLDQVLVHGVFHADPHPGNVLLTRDGRLALIDVGMIARVSPDLQEALLRLLVALSDGRGAEAAGALERAGEHLEGFDRQSLTREVSALVVATTRASVVEMQVGRQLADLARIAVASRLRPAPELSMLGKALLNLDDVARHLDPSYEPATAIREHSVHLMRHRMVQAASPINLVSAALDAKEFAERLPQRMNKVLDSLAEGNFRINVEGIDESGIMRSVQKLANRGAAGITVAAFVLAGAIFSISSTGPRWDGVSAFTIVLLGLAFVVALGMVLSTFHTDVPQRRRSKRRGTRRT